MQVLLEDMRRVLGAKTIFLPGSAEHAASLSRATTSPQPLLAPLHTNNPYYAPRSNRTNDTTATAIDQLGAAVQGLGILDSGREVVPDLLRHHPPKARRSRLELGILPPLNMSSESDKENVNLPVMRSRLNVNVMGLKEQRPGAHGGHVEMQVVEVAP